RSMRSTRSCTCSCRSSVARLRSSSRSPRSPRSSFPQSKTPLPHPAGPSRRREEMPPKKKLAAIIKLQIQAGQANPAPPVGPALGQHGVNIMEFCKAYNAATENQPGNVIPVGITVYEARSFTFTLKTPPPAKLLLKAAGVGKGSAEPQKTKVAKVTWEQGKEHCQTKN